MKATRGAASALMIAGLGIAEDARAGAFELFGVGPAGVAEVSARVARADDGSAAFYNPAGLAMGRGFVIELAPTFGVSALSAQGKRLPLADPFGSTLAIALPLPFEGAVAKRIRLGFAAYLPTTLLHFIARPGTEPFFPYYDNRSQRLVLLPALGVRISDRLALGASLNVLGGVKGPAQVLPGASGALESRIALRATTTVALNVGLRFDLDERVRFGITFRQRFALPAVVSTRAEVAGVPIHVDVRTESALYDPLTLVVAGSFALGAATVELDASYARWSDWDGPYAAVTAQLPGVNLASDLPPHPGRDVVSLRGAAAYGLDLGARTRLELHGGAGFEPSMLKSVRQGRTNLVDGDKVSLGLGAELRLREPFARVRALRFGAGVGTQIVPPSTQEKRACAAFPCPADTVAGPDAGAPGVGIDNPGFPRLVGGGSLWSASLGLGVEL